MSTFNPFDPREERTLPPIHSLLSATSISGTSAIPQPPAPPPYYQPQTRYQGVLGPTNSTYFATRHPHPPQQAPAQSPFAAPHIVSPPVRELPAINSLTGRRPSPVSSAGQSAFSAPSTNSGFPTPSSNFQSPPSVGHSNDLLNSRPSSYTAEAHSNRSSGQISNESTTLTDRSSKSAKPNKRVVGCVDKPGDGEYYVLEDGSHMRTVIAGERVNPAWGITKAGKPRKRLAKACATCREKKIKCEQGELGNASCGQCSRLGRVCKIPKDPGASPEPEEPNGQPNGAPVLKERAMIETAEIAAQDSAVKKRGHNTLQAVLASDRDANGSWNKDRSIITTLPHAERGEYFQDLHETGGPSTSKRKSKQPARGRIFRGPRPPPNVDVEVFDHNVDPYEADPDVTLYYLNLYFYYRAKGPYAAIPREHFLDWVQNCREKTVDDRMAIYAMMALGSVFGADKALKDAGRPIYELAYRLERERTTVFTLQLVHTRSALVLYHFAVGEFESAYEYTANAVRAATMLRYQDEYHIKNIDEQNALHEYGMATDQLKECRRRTFWVVYLFDRYNSFSYGSMGLIHDVEVFLRLPCRDAEFVAGIDPPKVPHFHGDSIREQHPGEPGCMALLVDVASIWGDVTGNAYKAVNRSAVVYKEYYLKYFDQTRDRMQSWVNSLPDHLQCTPENTAKAIKGKYFAKYYILWGVYCLVGMKLGRIGRCELLDDDIKRRNLRVSMYHARKWLAIVSQLSRAIWENPGEDIDFALVQPFPGYSILNAVDILSSGGKASKLAELTNGELEECKSVVTQGANFWIINKKQRSFIDDRQGLLSAYGIGGGHEADKLRIEAAIDRSFLPATHDMVYGISDEIFYEVVLDESTGYTDPLNIGGGI